MFDSTVRVDRIELVSYYQKRYQVGVLNDFSTKMKHYELIYKCNGTTEIDFDGETFIEHGKSVRFLPMTEYFVHYTSRTLEVGDYVYFTFDGQNLPQKMIHFSPDNSEKIERLFLRLYRTWTMRQDGYYIRCIGYVYEILSELELQSHPNYLTNRQYEQLSPALRYIEDHLTDDIDFSGLHTQCGMSYTYFKQLFLKKYGIPPSRYVTRLKMKIACEQLTAGLLSVSEIADLLGYTNVYYFSRVFRNELGCSATEYRKKNDGGETF